MTSRFRALVTATVLLPAFLNLQAASGRKQTFTGEVGDAMCGRQHMEGSPAECTRTCVSKGSKYALVVGDKVYILETSDKAALAMLDKLAGQNATVSGALEGDKIEVSTVTAAK